MKSAEKVAEEIYQELCVPKTSLKYGDPTMLIAKALTAYAEERVKIAKESTCEKSFALGRAEGLAEGKEYKLTYWQGRLKEARAETLEEAAKVAEEFEDVNTQDYYGEEIAKAIRAIKSGEGKRKS